MPAQTIICPHCQETIELTEALSHQIEEDIRKQFSKQTEELKEELRKKGLEVEKEKRAMWEKALKMAEEKSKQKIGSELKLLKEELEEKDKKLDESRKLELEVRREKTKLAEEKKEFELVMQRKMDEERRKVEEKVSKEFEETHRLREKEKDKVIEDLRKSLEDAQRKARQGSQQLQGEVQEMELEEILRTEFPFDQITEVPKGNHGADVLQKVCDKMGKICGVIIWESKRTKAWSDSWITKLKDDQRTVKADIAVLVSEIIPANIKTFSYRSGIWVTNRESIIGLATVLRLSLLQLAIVRQSAEGKSEKMEEVYNYLMGIEFRQKIEAIVESFVGMKGDLDREKRAYTKLWAQREKQIQRVVDNTLTMYGELQGIMGKSLPEIKNLELPPAQEELL